MVHYYVTSFVSFIFYSFGNELINNTFVFTFVAFLFYKCLRLGWKCVVHIQILIWARLSNCFCLHHLLGSGLGVGVGLDSGLGVRVRVMIRVEKDWFGIDPISARVRPRVRPRVRVRVRTTYRVRVRVRVRVRKWYLLHTSQKRAQYWPPFAV